jgi:hypothetical protein
MTSTSVARVKVESGLADGLRQRGRSSRTTVHNRPVRHLPLAKTRSVVGVDPPPRKNVCQDGPRPMQRIWRRSSRTASKHRCRRPRRQSVRFDGAAVNACQIVKNCGSFISVGLGSSRIEQGKLSQRGAQKGPNGSNRKSSNTLPFGVQSRLTNTPRQIQARLFGDGTSKRKA